MENIRIKYFTDKIDKLEYIDIIIIHGLRLRLTDSKQFFHRIISVWITIHIFIGPETDQISRQL